MSFAGTFSGSCSSSRLFFIHSPSMPFSSIGELGSELSPGIGGRFSRLLGVPVLRLKRSGDFGNTVLGNGIRMRRASFWYAAGMISMISDRGNFRKGMSMVEQCMR